jgi:hypothetical protein
VPYKFLTDEWVAEAKKVRDEFEGQGTPPAHAVRMNQIITDVPFGDGTVNVGLGILNTSTAWGKVDYKDLLKRWLDQTPEEWGFREANRTQPVRGAALPMGFNRQPHYTRGLLLVGDSGGMVNPFNGEGIAYAYETGRMVADSVSEALRTGDGLALARYPERLEAVYGLYFKVARIFVKVIGNPVHDHGTGKVEGEGVLRGQRGRLSRRLGRHGREVHGPARQLAAGIGASKQQQVAHQPAHAA